MSTMVLLTKLLLAATGNCGRSGYNGQRWTFSSDCTYEFDEETGKLVITGASNINTQAGPSPFVQGDLGNIKNLVKSVSFVGDNVSLVNAGYLFGASESLESVDLSNVTAVAPQAFYNSALKTVILSDINFDESGKLNSTFTPDVFMGTSIEKIYCPKGKNCGIPTGCTQGTYQSGPHKCATFSQYGPTYYDFLYSSENVVPYEKDSTTGIYQLGEGEDASYYLSAEAMSALDSNGNHTGSCGTLLECQASVLQTKGKCNSVEACQDLAQKASAGTFVSDGKFYNSLNDFISGNYDKKRIYTIDEANTVAGKTNSFKIRYR